MLHFLSYLSCSHGAAKGGTCTCTGSLQSNSVDIADVASCNQLVRLAFNICITESVALRLDTFTVLRFCWISMECDDGTADV